MHKFLIVLAGTPVWSRCLTKLVKTSKTVGLHGRIHIRAFLMRCGQSYNFACEIGVRPLLLVIRRHLPLRTV